jgi:hypothetical protein
MFEFFRRAGIVEHLFGDRSVIDRAVEGRLSGLSSPAPFGTPAVR